MLNHNASPRKKGEDIKTILDAKIKKTSLTNRVIKTRRVDEALQVKIKANKGLCRWPTISSPTDNVSIMLDSDLSSKSSDLSKDHHYHPADV